MPAGHDGDASNGPAPATPPTAPPPGLPPVEDVPLASERARARAAEGEVESGHAGRAPAGAVPAAETGGPAAQASPKARRRQRRKARPHPYAAEASPPEEQALSPRRVLLFWAGLALLLVGSGYLVAGRYSNVVLYGDEEPSAQWDAMLQVPLWSSLALLAFGFGRALWMRRLAMAGWLVGAFYLGLWAQDLFYVANQDYVNYAFALLFGVGFVYLAYHEWLTVLRRTTNEAIRFLSIAFVVGGGAYFLIDKIQAVRLGLIHVVSDHTKWMLDLFGQGDRAGLTFVVDETDNKSPTTFYYPETVNSCPDGTKESDWLRGNPGGDFQEWCADTSSSWMDGWSERLLHFDPPPADHLILPVSIILACTALQSIMVFVGLFAGTTASLRRKLSASLLVGAVVYVLNLVRNTGIIWFYGQGHASFWVMHDAIGKGGSLVAMIAIAFGVFRWFPEFLQALFGVLDLVERDGPIERALRMGRRRPPPGVPVPAPPAAAPA